MKVIMVMFDSLNRHFLPNFGCDWTHAPNFTRLGERAVTFDNSYICSMPCMPARRDFHTGRPNFLHRSWGPLEPFDDSVPRMLRENGVSSHLISDHYHYWEAGGATYHTQYSTWECIRGHEGDPWKGQVKEPERTPCIGQNAQDDYWHRQDWVNRSFAKTEAEHPQSKTFEAGLEFLERNHEEDNWFLQLETFDPHEPFFSHQKYKDLFDSHYKNYKGTNFDWPFYARVKESAEEVEHVRHEYAALLAMCDAKLGTVLDMMDEKAMWDDTMLVLWTDHGFSLGEHDCWAKCWLPFYQEIAHTPFFVWDPRSAKCNERRQALVQPALDLGPTLLDFFGLETTPDMTGKALKETIENDAPVREAALFGLHGKGVNVTDGRYVYMHSPATEENQPLYEYTLMPTHMRDHFDVEELRDKTELADPFSFTKGCKTLKIRCSGEQWGGAWPTCLYDLESDPTQSKPIDKPEVVAKMQQHILRLMKDYDSPPEQYKRLGLDRA
jgi:arylsulfatase A-like enzyme